MYLKRQQFVSVYSGTKVKYNTTHCEYMHLTKVSVFETVEKLLQRIL